MIVILMGPAGSGKTTVGKLLAEKLFWEFADGDDFHPISNIEKMSRGVPLTDVDRLPWLEIIHEKMRQWQTQEQDVVLACSALKRSYREMLGVNATNRNVMLVYLKGSYDLLLERLRARQGHYMGEQMLASQCADLEEPAGALTIDVARSPEEIVTTIQQAIASAAGKQER